MADIDPSQPKLFNMFDAAEGALELFPALWFAAEELTSPDPSTRQGAVDRLVDLDAPKLSPLIGYLLATRIIDSDIEIRQQIVGILGGLLSVQGDDIVTPEKVRVHIKAYLSTMRRRGVYSLLQVSDQYPSSESDVATLLNACSFAGNALSDIVLDRKLPVQIRRQAVNFISQVGFLDAIPALDRLRTRLESRMEGQTAMPFAPSQAREDISLLPNVQAALSILKAS